MQYLAYLFFALGVADLGLYLFGVDITGVSWSPAVFFLIGSVLQRRDPSPAEPEADTVA